MKTNHLSLVLFFFIFPLSYLSQTEDNYVFKSLDEALLKIEKVEYLDLSGKKLNEIPKEVYSLFHLKKPILNRNKISVISSEIKQLKNLVHLELSRNRFTSFPLELTSLKNLKILVLSRNHITAIPKEVTNLKKLENLDLWSNKIGNLPDEISQLKKLKYLDLRVDPLNDKVQRKIIGLLPHTKVHFSKPCNCGY